VVMQNKLHAQLSVSADTTRQEHTQCR